jgi:3-keto-5-aminohexanoate cleavage enzyme
MSELIITACAADCSMYPELKPRLDDSAALGFEVEAAWRAGAAIAHIHAPPGDYKAWASHTRAIRDRCDVLVQYGISIQSVEERREVAKNRPDMLSVALGAHNHAFVGRDLMRLHPREELAELMHLCRDNAIKPEFEVCALGDLWLLDDLAQKGLVSQPFMVTIFFGRPGGSWSPATIDEFMHRVKALPDGTFHFASVTGPAHLKLETMAVLTGGHVRVGTEDEPYLSPGVLGDNAQHVARIARIAKELGRNVASVARAREMLAISR